MQRLTFFDKRLVAGEFGLDLDPVRITKIEEGPGSVHMAAFDALDYSRFENLGSSSDEEESSGSDELSEGLKVKQKLNGAQLYLLLLLPSGLSLQ